MNTDPTKEEMLTFLFKEAAKREADDFDTECAIYWFASDWHGGQSSNLYSVLSTSPYKPGPSESGPEKDSNAEYLYEALEGEFTS